MKDFQDYTVEELASDQGFIQWVVDPEGENNAYWTRWVNLSPENADKATQAKKLISDIRFNYYAIGDHAKQRIWTAIQFKKNSPNVKHPSHTSRISRYRYAGIAASIAIFLVALYVFWGMLTPNWNEASTAYGEIKKVMLPDSSVVILNANSILRWQSMAPTHGQREVWLTGEAYFDVNKVKQTAGDSPGFRPFVVHLENMEIEVLGTTFNVVHRRENTQVVLNTGKVQLSLPKTAKKIDMLPGDMVEVEGDQQKVSHRKVEPSNYSAWKENKLIFNHQTLEEIATYLEDNYDYEVHIEPDSLKEERFSGSTPADQLEVLFISLESSFNVNVIRDDKSIVIKKKNLSEK